MPDPSHRAPQSLSARLRTVFGVLAVCALAGGLLVAVQLGGVPVVTARDATGPADTSAERDAPVASDPATPSPEASLGQTSRAVRGVQRTTGRFARLAAAQIRAERRGERRREARQARRAARAEAARQELLSTPFDITVGSFNVLGSQHTAPGGDRLSYPPASTRSPAAAALMAKHGVDVVGTQELQADQLRTLQSITGMAAYPGYAWGEAETDNSILWDDEQYELVSGDQFTITFMGRPRPQPIVRLRVRATGREFWVVNTHPSAGGGQYTGERQRGQDTLVGIVNGLEESGLPIFVTGDMNDREIFYCRVVAVAGLSAPDGGSYGGGCQPPPSPLAVDWVVGSPGISWSGYFLDTEPTSRRVSDHFFISATAHVE